MVANQQTFVAMSLKECGTVTNHSIIKTLNESMQIEGFA
jgi:hypothetical protein